MLRVSATSSAASTAPQPLAMAPTLPSPTSPSPSPAVALLALAPASIQFSLCHRFRHDPPLKFAAFHFHLPATLVPEPARSSVQTRKNVAASRKGAPLLLVGAVDGDAK